MSMSVSEISAEGLERYMGGERLFASHDEAWREIKAWIIALSPLGDTLPFPSVSEQFLAWTMSGRAGKRTALGHASDQKGAFLTSAALPSICQPGRTGKKHNTLY